MADPFVLHWSNRPTVAAPAGRGQTVVVQALADPPPNADIATRGKWLKTELTRCGITSREVAILLPRSAALVRRLTVPEVSDDELPDLVRMQAAMKATTPMEKLRLDFVALPKRYDGHAGRDGAHGHSGREVLLASLSATQVDEIVGIVRAAGCEPVSLGISPFAAAAWLVPTAVQSGHEGAALVVAIENLAAEVTLLRRGGVIFSHLSELHADDTPTEQARLLLGEITRTVIAADHLAADQPPQEIVLVGPELVTTELSRLLSTRYQADPKTVSSRDSLVGFTPAGMSAPEIKTDSIAAAAASLGGCRTSPLPSLDFLNPRKRIEKPDRRRLKIGIATAAGVAPLIGIFGWSFWQRSSIDSEIADLQTQKSDLEQQIKAGQPVFASERAVREWLASRTEWDYRLANLGETLPGTDRVYLSTLTLEPGVADSRGHITGTGQARTREDAEAVAGALASGGYRVIPKPIVQQSRDPEYPTRFDLDLQIPVTKPAS